ncbi:heavy metal translocating P-type ATPase [Magnetococcus marinus MC-1]|uniref:Heavy metal translocating P-type ATPase n=1 Tax=Magnetococcus marinus (strain ATCC BAA-1437 / JCM 17883 / MC-1) TaxID=156889 RepID=A0L6C8_MAGMM|nr:heavy metal translocating P-type ATPase [Magnetococcus marinus]ABK43521.1 heavy metal translocating P-type ATPase [Magnetococcus marinus MC-1]
MSLSPSVMQLPIEGMSCAACSSRLQRRLESMPGVTQASVNLATASARIEGVVTLEGLEKLVKQTGFSVPRITQTFQLEGLSCASCVTKVEQAVAKLSGVERVAANLATGALLVTLIPDYVSQTTIQQAVQGVGYSLLASQEGEVESRAQTMQQREIRQLQHRLVVGALLVLVNMAMMHGWLPGVATLDEGWRNLLQGVCMTPVVLWSGWGFHRGAWQVLKHGSANMNTLVSVGSLSAYVASVGIALVPQWWSQAGQGGHLYFDTAGMIIVLILIGRWLEARAKGKTAGAIQALLALTPQTALRVQEDGGTETIAAAQVRVGDRLLVHPGAAVPSDGVVEVGEPYLHEAMLTGEPLPVQKGLGDEVSGGTLNGAVPFTMRASRVGGDTALARIIAMVRQAQGAKPPIARLADRIAGVFVPIILALATLVLLVWWLLLGAPFTHSLTHFIAVMIVACPCALGLATPTSVMVGTGRAARLGMLMRGGDVLERAQQVNAVIFDKTGTLTCGTPVLVNHQGAAALLAGVMAVEAQSEHPIAQALVKGLGEAGVVPAAASKVKSLTGYGMQGQVGEETLLLGRSILLEQRGVGLDPTLMAQAAMWAEQGQSVIHVAWQGQHAGLLSVADAVKAESAAGVAALQARGCAVYMVTGDNAKAAQVVAAQLGIAASHVRADTLPDGKAQVVAELQGQGLVVAMVGDGINDAPALARADVGIALGSGTDVAMESADIILMGGDVQGVARAIALSAAVLVNIRQNLFWAFGYNALLIPIAAGVLVPWGVMLEPAWAAAAMGLSSVTVVSNALRLGRLRL